MPKKRAATLLLVFMMSLSVGVAAAEPPEREPTTARPPTAKAQPSEEPAPQENEEEVFANSGVVVEKVGKGSALEKADLQPGDVLYRWRRLPNPPANPTEASGKFASPFDWWDVKSEQAPRSAVELLGQREHRWKNWTILPGDWAGEARPNWPEEVTKLYLLGLHRIENGEIEVGVEVWQELVKRRVGGKFDLCRHWLTLRISETWAQAKHWQKIVPLLREIETAPSLNRVKAYAFQRLGKVALQSGDLERATDYLQKSRPVQMADSLSLATTLNNLGLVANYNGDLAQATDLLEKAIEIEEAQAPGSLMLAASMTNLAVAQRQSGDLPNAERNLKKTLQIEEIRTPKSLSVAATLNNLGSVEFYRGDLAYAAEYFKQAFAIQEKLSRLQDVATSLNNLGTVEARKGELQLAAEYFRRSLAILEVEAPASTELAHTLHNLGANARDLGDLPLATSYYERALAVKEHQAPDSLDLSITLSNLGALAFDSGDLSRASDFSRRAMEIEEKKAPNSLMVTYNLNTLGNVAFRRGNFELAKGYYQRALDIAERIAPDTSSNELLDLGRVARAMGDLNTAFNLFEHSLKVTESQLAHLGSSHETEAHFLSREQYPVYREALSLQLELNHPEVAFHLLERSRAQSYLAMFAERELVFSDLPPELDAERRQIAVQYDHTLQLVQNLIPVKDGQRITRIRGSLLMLRQRQQVLQHEIRERVPKLAAIQYPRPLDVLAVQQVLDSGTLLLSYSVGAEKTAIFVVSHSGGLQVKILPLGEQALRARVKLLLSLAREANGGSSLGEHRRTQLQAASREIFTALLGPVADRIAASERLLILPDGPLHVLPFGVLVHDAKDGPQYLAAWKPLHIALSATVYAELKQRRHSAGDQDTPQAPLQLAAFGDPVYPQRLAALKTTSTLPADGAGAGRGDPTVRGAAERGLFDFQPLPYTRREVLEIASLFPAGTVRTYLGPEALEERIKSLDPKTRILHLAAHASVDEHLPSGSFIALTIPEGPPPDGTGPQRDNGLLQVWEIFERVRLNADLVVLSACDTGLGEELGGEGLIGLTRAFQYAGARSVMASLWSVNDQATAELMIRFYKHLRAGLPKDQALQAAQRELIASPIEITNDKGERVLKDFSSPYYWAGFQLYGDWQ